MPGIVPVTDTSFDAEVLKCDLPVVAEFWAGWNAACRTMAPMLEEIAAEFAGAVKVARLDIDKNPAVTARYGVLTLPTLIVFKNGQAVERLTGSIGKEEVVAAFTPYLLPEQM